MKNLIAVVAVLFSVNAVAFGGDGNDRMPDIRNYVSYSENQGGDSDERAGWNYWLGLVSGVAASYSQSFNKYAICYPEDATAGQLADVATKHILDNPAKRTETAHYLIWESHAEAFGFIDSAKCWLNTTE